MYTLKCFLLFKVQAVKTTGVQLKTKSRFLFRKGAIEIILYLDKLEKAGYYEIYKQNFVVSRQAFAKLMKELENKEIVDREVVDSHPPRVNYSLNEKGKALSDILNKLEKDYFSSL